MSLAHATAVRTAIAQAVSDYASTGAKLIIYDSSNNVLATVVLSLGSASSGVCTVDPASVTISATGTADHATLFKSDGTTAVLTGLTVGTSAANVVLSSVSLVSGNSLDLSSVTYTAPA